MPRRDDLTLCVSSQIGCPLACSFCATGLLGLVMVGLVSLADVTLMRNRPGEVAE